ncbi:hypothetical protein B0H14DRAFT_3722154 [Mycena olivaceomarginata]|nr:hypothetical protein B0H14DRAFT_3722154 [Mycena olivaceomarginata]
MTVVTKSFRFIVCELSGGGRGLNAPVLMRDIFKDRRNCGKAGSRWLISRPVPRPPRPVLFNWSERYFQDSIRTMAAQLRFAGRARMKSGNDLSNCIRFGIGVYQYQNKLTGTSVPHLLATWIVLWGRGAQDVYFTKLPKHAASMKGRVLGLELWIDRHPRRGTSSKKRKPASVQVSKENTDPAKCPHKFVLKQFSFGGSWFNLLTRSPQS